MSDPVADGASRPHADAVTTMLAHVAEHGGPAQAAAARDLIERLGSQPQSAALLHAAEALVDAYLNDPYLTR